MHSINFSNGFNNFPFLIADFTKLNNVIKVLKQAISLYNVTLFDHHT